MKWLESEGETQWNADSGREGENFSPQQIAEKFRI